MAGFQAPRGGWFWALIDTNKTVTCAVDINDRKETITVRPDVFGFTIGLCGLSEGDPEVVHIDFFDPDKIVVRLWPADAVDGDPLASIAYFRSGERVSVHAPDAKYIRRPTSKDLPAEEVPESGSAATFQVKPIEKRVSSRLPLCYEAFHNPGVLFVYSQPRALSGGSDGAVYSMLVDNEHYPDQGIRDGVYGIVTSYQGCRWACEVHACRPDKDRLNKVWRPTEKELPDKSDFDKSVEWLLAKLPEAILWSGVDPEKYIQKPEEDPNPSSGVNQETS